MNHRMSSQLRRLEALRRRRSEMETTVADTVVMARSRGVSWVGGRRCAGHSARKRPSSAMDRSHRAPHEARLD